MNLTIEDAARLFAVSEQTIQRWIKQKNLPAHRINHQFHFNRTDILEWASEFRVQVAQEPPAASSTQQIKSTCLSDALVAGGIHHQIAGHDKLSVLTEVVGLLRLPTRVDRALLMEILLAREAMGSTAIGDGIAIPHARNPIALNVQAPAIALCFLKQPIDFDAFDDQPVHILFTLITPTVSIHLRILYRLMFVLRHAAIKGLLQQQPPGPEILTAIRSLETSLREDPARHSERRLE